MIKTIRIVILIILTAFICGCREEYASDDVNRDRSFLTEKDVRISGVNPFKNDAKNKKELEEYLEAIESNMSDYEKSDLCFSAGEKFTYLGKLKDAKKYFDLFYKYDPSHEHTCRIAFFCFMVEYELGNVTQAKKYLEEMQGQCFGDYLVFKWAEESGYFTNASKTKIWQDARKQSFIYYRDNGFFEKNEMSRELWKKYK